jgi:hypothetical protein
MGTLYTTRSGATAMTEDQFLQDLTDLLRSGGVKDLGSDNHFKVVPRSAGGANMSVDVGMGRAFVLGTGTNAYPVRHTGSVTNKTVTNNSSGSARKDAVVLYIDTAASPTATADNVAKFMVVAGTPAGSPVAPDDAAIQSAVGASNPFLRLADLTVSNGETTIDSGDITDRRVGFIVRGGGSLPPFTLTGTPVVQDGGFGPNWVVPPGVSAINRLDALALTAPTGAALILRIYNVTQAVAVGTVTIADGSRTGSNATMTNPSLNQGDELRLDVTQIGSTVPGGTITIQPSS